MIRQILVLFFTLLFILPGWSFADSTGEAPLTLLNKPSKGAQAIQNQSIANKTEELHDIYGPVPIMEQPPYLLIAGIVLIVLLIAAAIFWFFKKRDKQRPPPMAPWEKALLDLADAKKLLNPERALLYMDRVSQILRSYIESRFAVQSTRQTTREFFQGLTKIGGNSPLQAHKDELRGCLEQADMAKFAHHIPEIKNLEMMEGAVTTFIKRTQPVEPQKTTLQQKQKNREKRGQS